MSCDEEPTTAAPTASQQRQFDLEMAVVQYADAPDRCTVFPPTVDDCDRTTTWLSADRRAATALDEMR